MKGDGVRGGLGFSGALTVLFIGLKLCKVIDWPWLWVLSPLWITTILAVFLMIVMAIIISKNR